jgi:hypothetical protein
MANLQGFHRRLAQVKVFCRAQASWRTEQLVPGEGVESRLADVLSSWRLRGKKEKF